MNNQLHEISRPLYQLLTLKYNPFNGIISQNVAFFATDDRRLIVVIAIDFTDKDFNAVVMGRDKQRRYRTIDVRVSFPTIKEALDAAQDAVMGIPLDQNTFPQGDEEKVFDIYSPIVPEGKQDSKFQLLKTEEGYSPARETIRELCYHFKDKDGNFIEQFQTNGFNARLFELYMFAFLHEEQFFVDDTSSYPDYVFSKGSNCYAIECTTVNKGPNDIKEFPSDPDQIATLSRHYFPLKFGSALFSKLNHKTEGKSYWELSNVEGKPFIIAIEDFHFEDAMCYSYPGLEYYLYGYEYGFERSNDGSIIPKSKKITSFEWGGKNVDTCFFDLPGSENVSAVLLVNSGTLAKFNRMGKIAGLGSKRVTMSRVGFCYNSDPKSVMPIPFSFKIDERINETWAEGARLYHNPHAKYPVDPKDFTGIYQGFLRKDNCLLSVCPPFFPFQSRTISFVVKDKEEESQNSQSIHMDSNS